MGNTIEFKPKLKVAFLEYRRRKLLELKDSMDDNCSLEEWFKVSNNIRKLNRQIQEIKNARRYSKNA